VRVLASCDSKYFREHHKAFYASALSCGYTPLIDIINPDQDLYDKYKSNILQYIEVLVLTDTPYKIV